DGVGPARAVLEAEAVHVVAQLGQRSRRRAARQAGAHHEDAILALVGRVDQLHLEAVAVPLLGQGPGGGLGIQVHACLSTWAKGDASLSTGPVFGRARLPPSFLPPARREPRPPDSGSAGGRGAPPAPFPRSAGAPAPRPPPR